MTTNEQQSTTQSLGQTFSNVQTIYILISGELIRSLAEFEQVKDRFSWLDKKVILSELLHVRASTEHGKQSIIAVYEESKSVKSFLNLENDFHLRDLQLNSI
jgi:hypothetical protein